MKDLLRWMFTPFVSSPRRWALVAGMMAIFIVLSLLGMLP